MPLYQKKEIAEFQKVRDNIRKRSLSTTQRQASIDSIEEDSTSPTQTRSNSLTSVTSNISSTVTTSRTTTQRTPTDWRKLELRRTRSLSHSTSSRTSFEIPPLRSTRSCSSPKHYLRELDQAREMLEVCKEISTLTQEFAADYEESSREVIELPEVCMKLERYASDILIHLDGGKGK